MNCLFEEALKDAIAAIRAQNSITTINS